MARSAPLLPSLGALACVLAAAYWLGRSSEGSTAFLAGRLGTASGGRLAAPGPSGVEARIVWDAQAGAQKSGARPSIAAASALCLAACALGVAMKVRTAVTARHARRVPREGLDKMIADDRDEIKMYDPTKLSGPRVGGIYNFHGVRNPEFEAPALPHRQCMKKLEPVAGFPWQQFIHAKTVKIDGVKPVKSFTWDLAARDIASNELPVFRRIGYLHLEKEPKYDQPPEMPDDHEGYRSWRDERLTLHSMLEKASLDEATKGKDFVIDDSVLNILSTYMRGELNHTITLHGLKKAHIDVVRFTRKKGSPTLYAERMMKRKIFRGTRAYNRLFMNRPVISHFGEVKTAFQRACTTDDPQVPQCPLTMHPGKKFMPGNSAGRLPIGWTFSDMQFGEHNLLLRSRTECTHEGKLRRLKVASTLNGPDHKVAKLYEELEFGGLDSIFVAYHLVGRISGGKIEVTKEMLKERMPDVAEVASHKINSVHEFLKQVKEAIEKRPDDEEEWILQAHKNMLWLCPSQNRKEEEEVEEPQSVAA